MSNQNEYICTKRWSHCEVWGFSGFQLFFFLSVLLLFTMFESSRLNIQNWDSFHWFGSSSNTCNQNYKFKHLIFLSSCCFSDVFNSNISPENVASCLQIRCEEQVPKIDTLITVLHLTRIWWLTVPLEILQHFCAVFKMWTATQWHTKYIIKT